MNNVSKTAILPILSILYVGVEAIIGHKLSVSKEDVATVASIVITAGISVWGVIKNHKKEVK